MASSARKYKAVSSKEDNEQLEQSLISDEHHQAAVDDMVRSLLRCDIQRGV
jgi:hypothetical protein